MNINQNPGMILVKEKIIMETKVNEKLNALDQQAVAQELKLINKTLKVVKC